MTVEPIRVDDRIRQHLRRLGQERDGLLPFGPGGPMAWHEQGIYTLQWDTPGPALDGPERSGPMVELDYIRTDKYGDTGAEIAVYWSDPATH